jgi:hypothetical protein
MQNQKCVNVSHNLREKLEIDLYFPTWSSTYSGNKLALKREIWGHPHDLWTITGCICQFQCTNKQTPWPESASELYRLGDRRLSAKLVPTFAVWGHHVVSVTDPHCRILAFLHRSCYFFFQVPPHLYSWGWVDPVPDPLLHRKSGSAGNRTQTSGCVARNTDHQAKEAVYFLLPKKKVKLAPITGLGGLWDVKDPTLHI